MAENNNVAVYWDFENIHISLCSLSKGESWYKNNMFTRQPELIDINRIMEFISGLGEVNINKAYANWSFFHAYSFSLQSYSIDLLQLFPRGRYGKNGADIRIAIDILEDCLHHPHLNTVVLISGDSDYISIAQKVRQMGKRIIGIGVQETTNQFWIKACNEFKFYSSIARESGVVESESEIEFDLDEAKVLLKKALLMLFSETSKDYALRVAIKPVMLRLDPTFDEINYGCSSFTEFLNKCDDIIETKEIDKDLIIFMKDKVANIDLESDLISASHPYERILKKQQIRLVPYDVLSNSLSATFEIFKDEKELGSYLEFRNKLREKLRGRNIQASDTDTAKIKSLLYKAFSFQLNIENKTISLSDDIKTESDIKYRVYQMIIKRILDNVDGSHDIDVDYLSTILFGDEQHQDDVNELIADYNNRTSQLT